jgi:hypothetical protein
MIVLDTLTPAERLAFVLPDVCEMSFDESPELVTRGRRRRAGFPISDDHGHGLAVLDRIGS